MDNEKPMRRVVCPNCKFCIAYQDIDKGKISVKCRACRQYILIDCTNGDCIAEKTGNLSK